MSIISSFAHFEDASSAFSRRLPARATASHDRSARELRVTGPCDHARSWTFLCLILIIIVLFGVTSFAPLYSILVLFNYVRRAALFSLSIVLSCFIYSIFLQPWFCPAALAANAAAFGRSLRWVFQGFPTSEKKGAKECTSCRSRKILKNAPIRPRMGEKNGKLILFPQKKSFVSPWNSAKPRQKEQ